MPTSQYASVRAVAARCFRSSNDRSATCSTFPPSMMSGSTCDCGADSLISCSLGGRMQCWNYDHPLFLCFGVANDDLAESLRSLGLQGSTNLERFAHCFAHRREAALIPYPLETLKAS